MRIVLTTALLALLSVCPSASVPLTKKLVPKWHGPLIKPLPWEPVEGGCSSDCECIPIDAYTPHDVTLQLFRHLSQIPGHPYENPFPRLDERELFIKNLRHRPTYKKYIRSTFTAIVPTMIVKRRSGRFSQIHRKFPSFMITSFVRSDSNGKNIVKHVTQKDIIKLPFSTPGKGPVFEVIDEDERPDTSRYPIHKGSKGKFTIIKDDEEHSESKKPTFHILDATEEDENPLEDIIFYGASPSEYPGPGRPAVPIKPLSQPAGSLVKIGQTS